MALLREVLDTFEQSEPLTLAQVARQLGVEASALDGMIQFWVNKGKLREVSNQGCASCGIQHGCPVLAAVPRRYERVTDAIDANPPCQCKY